MTNSEIAHTFERMALILDLKGNENPFRIRAYQRAAMMIENLTKDLNNIYQKNGIDALQNLPGIGNDLAEKIEELLKTGKLSALSSLEKKIPPGLFEIMKIEGMGPKKTKFIWQTFSIKDIEELKILAQSGKLTKIKGWGQKSIENILKGIELKKKMSGRLPINQALTIAKDICAILKNTGLCSAIEIAGSLRRRKETCGDIDILVTSDVPEKIMDAFCRSPFVDSVISKGKTKSTVFLKAGLDCDLRVVAPDVFGAALHYFTGSKDHNVHMRKLAIAKGVTISEYGVYEGTAAKKGGLLASKTEKDVFSSVGLSFIQPEFREDHGEIEAATNNTLPRSIEENDIQGDLHLHSTFSDGKSSMIQMAKAAKKNGLKYIAITDHASPMGMVKGIKEKNITKYIKKIDEARQAVPDIHILAGAEVDILADGSLYLPDAVLAKLDWIVASVHQNFKQNKEEYTNRIIRAIRNPHVRIIGHPTTRMVGKREGIEIDIDAIARESKKHNVTLELNASPYRLDLNDIHLKRVKELGGKICINSDAHSPESLSLTYGIFQARRGWLESKDVINTMDWTDFEAWRTSGF